MKRKKMLVMATVFAMLFGLAQIAGASTLNPFTTTDGDSDVINYNFGGSGGLANGWYFGVYDFGVNLPSSGSSLDLLLGSSSTLFESAEFSVTQPGGSGTDWIITVISGLNSGNSFGIGPTDDFSFYFRNGSTYDIDFEITSGGGDAYLFASDIGGGNVLGDDLNPVPLPGAAIFLFSGIMGLVAFGSRRKIMK